MKGEPEVDIQKVEPQNKKFADLDSETRQTYIGHYFVRSEA